MTAPASAEPIPSTMVWRVRRAQPTRSPAANVEPPHETHVLTPSRASSANCVAQSQHGHATGDDAARRPCASALNAAEPVRSAERLLEELPHPTPIDRAVLGLLR